MAKKSFRLAFLVLLGLLTNRTRQDKRFCSTPSVYFTRQSQIFCVQLDKMGTPLASPLLIHTPASDHANFKYSSIPFTLDVRKRTIYWMDAHRKEINQMDLNGTAVVIAVDGLVGEVHSLALDWLSENIYWSDFSNKWIGVASLQRKVSKVFAYEDISNPRGLAVDPVEGYLFWADVGDVKKIERCTLDGSGRTTLVNTGLAFTYDLSVDTVKKRLYWMDKARFCSVSYIGDDRFCFSFNKMVSLLSPYGFAFSSTLNTVYVSDLKDHIIKSYDFSRNQSNNRVTPPHSYSAIFYEQVKVYEATTERQASTPCLKPLKPCSHICFVINGTHFSCACPSGMRLLEDQRSCKDEDMDFGIYVADPHTGNLFRLSKFVNQDIFKVESVPNPAGRNSFPLAVTYDKREEIIYWCDYSSSKIYRMHSNGTGFKPVVATRLGSIEGLSFDHIGRLIYWSDYFTKGISIARSDGSSQVTIAKGLKGYLSYITLYPEKGILFYAAWHTYSRVQQMDMDGTNPIVIFDHSTPIKVSWPNGLALDREAGKLYCIDATYKRIVFYDINSQKSAVLFTKGSGPKSLKPYPRVDDILMKEPYGLTLHDEYLYWTEWGDKAIHGLNRLEGHWKETYLKGFHLPEDIQAFDLSKRDKFKYLNIISSTTEPCDTQCNNHTLTQITFGPCPLGYRLKRQHIGCYKTSYDPELEVRTECSDWASCSLRLEYTMPCLSVGVQFVHIGLRQCVQTLKNGYCPSVSAIDCQTLQACQADQDCPGTEKCCSNACGKNCLAPIPQPLDSHPCQTTYKACNICVPLPNNKHRCLCPTGQYLALDGITCRRDEDICANHSCQNNGTCKVSKENPSCSCLSGFTGNFCETSLVCASNPCLHGGTCMPLGSDYLCHCSNYTKGKNCKLHKECDVNDKYACACKPGYSGNRCENPLYCQSNPCGSNGKCEEDKFGYSCKCLPGFSGRNCEQSLHCSEVSCKNNGTCVAAKQYKGIKYQCQCTLPFTGAYCETKLYCPGLNCKNNGSCIERGPVSYCDCRPDYTGKDCSSKLNTCVNNKCQNNGKCLYETNSYRCKCRIGYSGKFCETHQCSPDPCQNSGHCQKGTSSICDCLTYYIGEYCNIYIGNNVFSATMKSNQGTKISVRNFKVTIAKLYNEFCSQRVKQRSDSCIGIGGRESRKRREAANKTLEITAENIYVVKGFPKLLEDGSQQFQYTVLLPEGKSTDRGPTLASLDFIEKGFVALRNFTERELGARIIALKRYLTNEKNIPHMSTSHNYSLAIWLPIVTIIVLIVIGISVVFIRKRKRNHTNGYERTELVSVFGIVKDNAMYSTVDE